MRRLLLRCLPERWRSSIEGDLAEGAARGRRPAALLTLQLAWIVVRVRTAELIDRLPPGPRPLAPLVWARDAGDDLRFGVRRWVARPGFAATAVATVALGIGSTSALFSVVDGVLLKPLPYPHADRLVVVNRTYPEWRSDPMLAPDWDRTSLAWPEFFYVRDRTRTAEAFAVVTTDTAVLGQESPRRVRVGVASASFFTVLGATPAAGALFAPAHDLQDPQTVVLSHALWQQEFGGDPNVVGRALRLDSGDRTIAGVLSEHFHWGTRQLPYDIWCPLASTPAPRRVDNDRNLTGIARLRPGVTLPEAAEEMGVLLRAEFRFKSATGAAVTPLLARQLQRVRAPLLILLAGATLLLAIACGNVAGLLLSDTAARECEIVVRTSLGASTGRLFRQLVAECLVLTGTGAGVGLLLALWAVRLLTTLAPPDLPRAGEIAVDLRVVAFASASAVLTALVFALGPAWKHRRSAGAQARAGRAAANRASAVVVLVEVALGIGLLGGAGLFVRTLYALQQVDTGFDRSNLLTMRVGLPATRYPEPAHATRFFASARAALARLPGVTDAAVAAHMALATGTSSTTISLPGDAPRPVNVLRQLVSPEYFRTLGIAILNGRTFEDRDGKVPGVAVVSREMERRYWPGGAVGRTFTYAGATHTVIGTVNDIRDLSLRTEPQATFYLSTLQRPAWPTMQLIVRTAGDPASLAAAARQTIAALDSALPLENVHTMSDLVHRSTDHERYRAVLMSVFGLTAALLSAVGLYHTLARRVLARRREIGVRLALGARPQQVRRLFLREGLLIAAAGALLGIPVALLIGRAASSLLFEVRPWDPLTLAVVTISVTLLAIVSTYVPSLRASRTDPASALRAE